MVIAAAAWRAPATLHGARLLGAALCASASVGCTLDEQGVSASASGAGGDVAASSSAASGSGGAAASGSSTSAGASGGMGASGGGGSGTGGDAGTCAASIPSDDFEDGALAEPPWVVFGTGTATEAGGALHLAPPIDGGYEVVRTPVFDLHGCAILVQVVGTLADTANGATTFKALVDGTSTWLRIGVSGGQIRFSVEVDGTNLAASTTDYSLPGDAWWRIRELDGMVHFETAADGAAWVERLGAPTPRFVSSVQLEMQAVTYQGGTDPGEAIFDNANLAP